MVVLRRRVVVLRRAGDLRRRVVVFLLVVLLRAIVLPLVVFLDFALVLRRDAFFLRGGFTSMTSARAISPSDYALRYKGSYFVML